MVPELKLHGKNKPAVLRSDGDSSLGIIHSPIFHLNLLQQNQPKNVRTHMSISSKIRFFNNENSESTLFSKYLCIESIRIMCPSVTHVVVR